MGYNFHSLQLGDNGLFVKAMGFKSSDHPRILSSHHQALEKMGRDSWPSPARATAGSSRPSSTRSIPTSSASSSTPSTPCSSTPSRGTGRSRATRRRAYLAILEGTPPSVEFNKAIWRWFAGRLVESHGK